MTVMNSLAASPLEELSGQISNLTPRALNEYASDSGRGRFCSFLDILRRRANQRQEMIVHGIASVLIRDTEPIMRMTDALRSLSRRARPTVLLWIRPHAESPE
jgi:hypothetical protein